MSDKSGTSDTTIDEATLDRAERVYNIASRCHDCPYADRIECCHKWERLNRTGLRAALEAIINGQ
jgi:hypothetical protein